MEIRIGAYILSLNGIFFAFAGVCFLWVAYQAVHPRVLTSRSRTVLVLSIICTTGGIGALLYGRLADMAALTSDRALPIESAFVPGSMGGIWGILLGGALCGSLMREIGVFRLTDRLVPALIIGAAIARIGEVFEGTSPGIGTRLFGINWFQPFLVWPLYDIAALATTFAAIPVNRSTDDPAGSTLIRFLIVYGLLRFLIEFVREADTLALNLTYGQVMCGLQLIVASVLWISIQKRNPS